jgi:hypothetical protein
MNPASDTLIALKRPPGRSGLIECRPLPDLLILMEAASKAGEAAWPADACARSGGAIAKARKKDTASAAIPAAAAMRLFELLRVFIADTDVRYIMDREIHYKKINFEEELLVLLRKHGLKCESKFGLGGAAPTALGIFFASVPRASARG